MTTPNVVPLPDDAGSGQNALIDTKLAFANIRSGPGTNYDDIGDLRDYSLVVYYPGSKSNGNWFFIRYRGVEGWVSGDVVTFEPTVGVNPEQPTTPYDGKVAVWHWKGDAIPEATIDAFASNLKQRAPNVKQVWVKTSDGPYFMGQFDRSALAINGEADIDRWVQVLAKYDLEFHAWCVPTGLDPERETAVIIATCSRPGVRSMILDVEPYAGFWQGGEAGIRPYMLAIRRVLGGEFHIGMSMDPRPQHFDSIFPNRWFPFVDSIHPQSYWYTFRQTPEQTLQSTFNTWGSYGRPVIPALQGDAPLVDQTAAHALATGRFGATGLSWWRYGVISQFGAVNLPIEIQNPGDPVDDPDNHYAEEVIVVPRGEGFRFGSYAGPDEFGEFEGTWNWPVLYSDTETGPSNVWVEWSAQLPQDGRYEISAFVPARHATTQKARYKVHGIRGTNTEVVIDINQAQNRNRWVPLGIFDIERNRPNAGKVFLNDKTNEAGREIAFDAVRFRRIVTTAPPTGGGGSNGGSSGTGDGSDIVDGVFVADGYDSPVGTDAQRRDTTLWPDGWLDASPFGRLYFVGTPSEAYHTGADLNFGTPYEDKGLPVYSPASGVVTFAGSLPVWGLVIVIKHDPLFVPSGQVLYSRSAHVQNVLVNVGQRVKRGDQIAEIGDAFGRFIPHLHFDLSPTTILETSPQDWPGTNRAALLRNYIDPLAWIRRNRP